MKTKTTDSPSPANGPRALPVQGPLKIYVASSWRNDHQPLVVAALREDGYTVYDFKDSEGFHWSEVDPNWKSWPEDILKYISGLYHHCADRGFLRDMTALRDCDVCVYVMPCGVSASMEFGWAVGAGKRTIAYIPAIREPDLMVKMADFITTDLAVVRNIIRQYALERSTPRTHSTGEENER